MFVILKTIKNMVTYHSGSQTNSELVKNFVRHKKEKEIGGEEIVRINLR